ncbi:2-isopropylmalate synthase [uncultured Vagococcus sp.]|uniref:2-isopropylmalate synthase n=1 Tax=uncultured Vagococcus sp. TaxID=189676 RepID=UPI0028D47FF9|nr:2-isopropylmalate synthase [uncultured Vagococcus sp.]
MKIQFFDTTLRDGEQTPGVNFNTKEKVRIAQQLEKWGIDAIEAGFPNSSIGDFEAVQAIAKALSTTTVVGLARCYKPDIDRAYDALSVAKFPQIHLFLATSDIHMEYKLKKTPTEVLAAIKEHVSYAKTKFDVVQFSPEDATRTRREFLLEAVQTAVDAGATIINVPDTVGYSNPTEYGAIFKYLIDHCQNIENVIFSPHCHDDLGMATANSLAAVENGARRVEGTINGIGERAGNTALEEVALALHVRKDFYQHETNIVLGETKRTSDLVSQLSGVSVPRNKAIIGANAYAHESGIHQDGVLKNPDTYEIITPSLVGVATNSLPLGKLSGRHAFTSRMEEMGYQLSDEEMNQAFKKFKALADKKKQVTESDLHALIVGQASEGEEAYRLHGLQLQYVSDGKQGAIVSIETDEGIVSDSAIGSGSIQAIYNTIDRLMEQAPRLNHFSIKSVTEGEDAQAEVHVTVQDQQDGRIYNGVGIDFDVLQASAKAYIQASNYIKGKG